jgi:hypothetical protein
VGSSIGTFHATYGLEPPNGVARFRYIELFREL